MIDLKKQLISVLKYFGVFNFLNALIKRKQKKLLEMTIDELKLLDKKSESEIFQLNNNLLFQILNHAYKTTEYYKNLIETNNIDINEISSFKKLPLLDKNKIQKNSKKNNKQEFQFQKTIKTLYRWKYWTANGILC